MKSRLAMFAVLLAASAAHAATTSAAAELHYTFKVAANLSTLEAQVCFVTAPPARLILGNMPAARHLRGAALERGGQMFPVQLTPQGLLLATARPGDCLKYVTGLAAVSQPLARTPATTPATVLTTSADWLWYDATASAGTAIQVRFDLPPDMRVSVPWPVLPSTDAAALPVYQVLLPRHDWPDQIAIGLLQQWSINSAGARLQVSIIDAVTANAGVVPSAEQMQRGLVGPWLEEAVATAATIHGKFPLPAPEVLIVPTTAGTQPVGVSRVFDGGRGTVFFAIDPRHALPEFLANPTAVATFLRLLLPPMQPDASWLVDGLALYYQDVARVRQGTMSSPEAWVRLNGGMASRRTDKNAHDAWTGATFWLLADLDLRDESGGRQSLDSALAQLSRCCRTPEQHWTAAQLWQRLDGLTRSKVFTRLQTELASDAGLPATARAFDALGIHISDSELQIDDAAPLACVRENIMQSQRLKKQCTAKEVAR